MNFPNAAPSSDSSKEATVPLIDRFGRTHTSLRISVTDRCNIRCRYCMPETDVQFMPARRWVSFANLAKLVEVLGKAGIRKIRLTGGEPLMRPGLDELIALLSSLSTVEDLALTTNGMLFAEQARRLKSAGLMRINISLDTLQEETFQAISRRSGLKSVLDGIEAALEEQFEVRLNAMILRDINLSGVVELVRFARDRNLTLRFIEFMPLDADRQWDRNRMVSGTELRDLLTKEFGPLAACHRNDPNQPSTDYDFMDGKGRLGFIDTVSAPFCSSCNRLRLTADGVLRNCLFGRDGWNLAPLLDPLDEHQILSQLKECVLNKHASHGISEQGFEPPSLAMYQIGG